MSVLSRSLATLSFVAVWFSPTVANACPSCFSGNENREQYILTFVLLTVLPLAAIGGLVWWFVRRVRAVERVEAEGSGPS